MRHGGTGQMPAKDHPAGITSNVVTGRKLFWGPGIVGRYADLCACDMCKRFAFSGVDLIRFLRLDALVPFKNSIQIGQDRPKPSLRER